MKKLNLKVLFILMVSFVVTSAVAEKRYVFSLGGHAVESGSFKSDWVDYRLNDVDRTLYIWPAGESVVADGDTQGVMGDSQTPYWKVGNLGWWGVGYFVAPPAGNTEAFIDLTDVVDDGTWVFHFALKSDVATDVTINLYGSSADPSDPFIKDLTQATYVINKANYPLAKRDGSTWTEFSIPMSQLFGQPGMAGGSLSYAAPIKGNNYLTLAGGNDKDSHIAWDNVYIGKLSTGIDNIAVEPLDFCIYDRNQIVVRNNEQEINIFNMTGVQVMSSKENTFLIDILPAGIYIMKAGNKVAKFSK